MKVRLFKDKIIAYKKGEKYIAVSLEFDLIAEGKDIMSALSRLRDSTEGYLEMCCKENEPDSEIYRKAPTKYQKIYDLFVDISKNEHNVSSSKRQEKALLTKEVQSANFTYSYA